MNKKRVAPKDTVQADVLLRSRRRCCICYGLNRDLTIRKGQIAHLDQDRNNNKLENLVFLCIDHHDEYDSKTSQSKGIQKKEVELYRKELDEFFSTWTDEHIGDEKDLKNRVLLEISLIPHQFKNNLFVLSHNHAYMQSGKDGSKYTDVWEMLQEEFFVPYSEQNWRKFRPLFVEVINGIISALEKHIIMYNEYVPIPLKLAILKSVSQLRVEASAYNALQLNAIIQRTESPDSMFIERFKSTLLILGQLSRLAERVR